MSKKSGREKKRKRRRERRAAKHSRNGNSPSVDSEAESHCSVGSITTPLGHFLLVGMVIGVEAAAKTINGFMLWVKAILRLPPRLRDTLFSWFQTQTLAWESSPQDKEKDEILRQWTEEVELMAGADTKGDHETFAVHAANAAALRECLAKLREKIIN